VMRHFGFFAVLKIVGDGFSVDVIPGGGDEKRGQSQE